MVTTLIFVGLWSMLALILDLPLHRSLLSAFIIGFGYGLYEEFYVQSRHSLWLRRYSTLLEMLFNISVVVLMLLVMMHLNHLVNFRLDRLGKAYDRLPVILPVLIVFSTFMVTLLRVISFIGGRNLFFLMTGKYRKPVIENKVFMFLDMKDSTQLVEQLGPIKTRELIGKLFYDISRPIANHDGEIYRFTGDGLVATWSLDDFDDLGFLLDMIDDIFNSISNESEHYQSNYSHQPEFRIGMHCGKIVVSEEGNIKRAIGYYGEAIHIAARLEQQAKKLGKDFLLSASVVSRIKQGHHRLNSLGPFQLKGIHESIEIFELSAGKNPL